MKFRCILIPSNVSLRKSIVVETIYFGVRTISVNILIAMRNKPT